MENVKATDNCHDLADMVVVVSAVAVQIAATVSAGAAVIFWILR